MERHTIDLEIKYRWLRIPYNSGISKVWVNEETHDKYGDKVTAELKKKKKKGIGKTKNKKEGKKINDDMMLMWLN